MPTTEGLWSRAYRKLREFSSFLPRACQIAPRWVAITVGVVGAATAVIVVADRSSRFGTILPASYSAPVANVEPPLVFSGDDVGQVWRHDRFPWEVKIKNRSNGVVNVLDLKASCQCVDLRPRSFPLKPGETKAVRLLLDLSSQAKPDSGFGPMPFRMELRPVVRPGSISPMVWSIRGTIAAAARMEPPIVDFGELLEGDPLPVREFAVHSIDGAGAVALVEAPAWLRVELHQVSDSRWKGVLHPERRPPVGPIDGTIRLAVTSPRGDSRGVVQVPLTGKSVDDIGVEPLPLSFGVLSGGQASEAQLTILSRSGKAITVEVTRQPRGLQVVALPTTDASQRRFRLVYTAPSLNGEQYLIITFTIRDSNHQILAVISVNGFASIGATAKPLAESK